MGRHRRPNYLPKTRGRLIGTSSKGINQSMASFKPFNPWQAFTLGGAYAPKPMGTVQPKPVQIGINNPVPAVKPGTVPSQQAPKTSPKQIDPRDSAYYSALAQNLFTRNQGLQTVSRQKGEANLSYQTLLQRLAPQENEDLQQTKETANQQGLFYSGILGKRLADVTTDYTNRRTDARTDLESTLASLAQQQRGLITQYGAPGQSKDYGLSGAQLLTEAIGRQQERDAGAAELAGQQAYLDKLAQLLAPPKVPTSGAGDQPVVVSSGPQIAGRQQRIGTIVSQRMGLGGLGRKKKRRHNRYGQAGPVQSGI